MFNLRAAQPLIIGAVALLALGCGEPSGPNPDPNAPTRAAAPSDSIAQKSSETTVEPARDERPPEEILALIDQVGRTPPGWFDETPLVFPKTLDLSFPKPPPKPWNNQRNVGQYIWDVINPNPGKWREGVRFLHHLLIVNEGKPEVQKRVMTALGRMYHNLHEDYARAAFWWRQAGVDEDHGPPASRVHLAGCYWRLGSKAMAVERLEKLLRYPQAVKLWADMGETERALERAESMVTVNNSVDLAYLWAGDACRMAGDYDRALEYYQKCLALDDTGPRKGRIRRTQKRARASAEAIELFELSDVSRVPDGRYSASSLGYEGQVAVEVTVRDRRIQAVRVTDHREKQFYSSIRDTPRRIVEAQGVQGVDATSGATITSEAIINATAKALAQAAD